MLESKNYSQKKKIKRMIRKMMKILMKKMKITMINLVPLKKKKTKKIHLRDKPDYKLKARKWNKI